MRKSPFILTYRKDREKDMCLLGIIYERNVEIFLDHYIETLCPFISS